MDTQGRLIQKTRIRTARSALVVLRHIQRALPHGGIFNVGGIDTQLNFLTNDFSVLNDSRFQGWFAGAGLAYGYDLILGRHWNLEFEVGAGYAYTRYDQFECQECGSVLAEDMTHHYIGITKAAISLVFLF